MSSLVEQAIANLKQEKLEEERSRLSVYELYRGEEFIGKGTAKDLAREFDIPVRSIYSFASKDFHERATEGLKGLIAFREGEKPKPTKFKTILEEKADTIVDLYFKNYDLKTLLKVVRYE